MNPTPDTASPNPPVAPAAPRPVRLAAALIVLRDGPQGLEVLLLRRADKANDQNSGATVFPGGMVDAHDRVLHALCSGPDDAAASARLEVAAGGLDHFAAAVRECFEEAGVLFADDARGQPVQLDRLAASERAAMRQAAAAGTDALLALCQARGWRLATGRLAYFAHWLTPPGMPRRFDTRFFIAHMPPGQDADADGVEIVQHAWLRPAEALDPARGLKLMNVTRRILETLAGFDTVQACLDHARELQAIPRVMPRLAGGPGGPRAVNMEEAAYAEVSLVDPDGRGHARHTLEGGLVLQLTPRVWRVTAHAPGGPGAHSYFVGDPAQGWALIDPLPGDAAHDAALHAAAPGPVRWVLFTRDMPGDASSSQVQAAWPEARVERLAPGATLAVGAARLQVLELPDDAKARPLLLLPDAMLFAGSASQDASLPGGVAWVAPAQGFLRRLPIT